jgi:hypothetical protein
MNPFSPQRSVKVTFMQGRTQDFSRGAEITQNFWVGKISSTQNEKRGLYENIIF